MTWKPPDTVDDVKLAADDEICELLVRVEVDPEQMTEFLLALLECVTFQLKTHLEEK